jgi:hypothetical protein
MRRRGMGRRLIHRIDIQLRPRVVVVGTNRDFLVDFATKIADLYEH